MIDDTWYQRKPGAKVGHAAGGVVARVADGRVWFAFARHHGKPDYVLPKGHIEKGESPRDAALREIQEEAGFTDLTWLADLDVLDRYNFPKTEWKTTHYFLFHTRQVDAKPTESKSHPPPDWFAIDDLPAIFWPEQRRLIEQHRDQIVQLLMGQSDA